MAVITSFEDIKAWQAAKVLTKDIYVIFKNNRDYSFKDQIQRASVSIMNNIAEGFERRSNKELKNFLFIAKGSCGEVRSMVLLARDIGYMHENESEKLIKQASEISKMLSGFIKRL